MWIIVFIFAIIIVCCVHTTEDVPAIKGKKQEQMKQAHEYITENNVNITKKYDYQNSLYAHDVNYRKGISIRFIVDSPHRYIHIFQKPSGSESTAEISIPFDQIIGCEIMTDSKVTGGIGRAVVGGVLAGDVGAFVGAMTAPEKIMSYKIVIYKNNPANPMIEIPLIEGKTSTKNSDYIEAVRFAENVNAVIRAIVYQNNTVSI